MSQSVQPIPPGMEQAIPHLVCDRCPEAIEFYKKAFGAAEMSRVPAPDGQRLLHAAIKIGNSHIFLASDFPEYCGGKSQSPTSLGGTPVTIHRYVPDCDAAMQRAVDAGATVDAESLVKAGVLRRAKDGVRLLGSGEIRAKVAFSVWGASRSAVAAVEKAGGSVAILAPKRGTGEQVG